MAGRAKDSAANNDDERELLARQNSVNGMTLETGVNVILRRYPTREEWIKSAKEEIAEIEDGHEYIHNESETCGKLTERTAIVRAVRNTLIRNHYGNITTEMVQNSHEWEDYVERVSMAQEQVQKALNWLELSYREWQRRDEIFPTFWDLWEKADQDRVGELRAVVAEILFSHFGRLAFLNKRFVALDRVLEALYEVPPEWLEWDVLEGGEEQG